MATESGRFYDADGFLYEDAGLREARKLLLYPSVSQVHSDTLPEPWGLKVWKERQLILAASTEPRRPHDSDEEYVERVMQSWAEEGAAAAEYGKQVHAGIQQMMDSLKMTPHPDVPPEVNVWIAKHLGHGESELTMVNTADGYAGTTDYVGPYTDKHERYHDIAIVDFKTQKVTTSRKSPRKYEKWPLQLAAYNAAYIGLNNTLHGEWRAPSAWVSVIMNTNRENPVWRSDTDRGFWVH